MVGSATPKATQDKLQQFADEINRQTANCSNDANYNGAINSITKWNAVTNSDARTYVTDWLVVYVQVNSM